MSPTVGVVILDMDQAALTRRCLAALLAGTERPDHVVLVENGLTRVALPHSWLDELNMTLLRPANSLGCAGGRNHGIDHLLVHTDASQFIVLDNDAIVSSDFIERVRALRHHDLDVMAPVILDYFDDGVWSAGGLCKQDGSIAQLKSIQSTSAEGTVDWAPGACLVIPRKAWLATGHFDTWIGFLFEDIEWCHRLRALGGHIKICPELLVWHEANQSLGGGTSPIRDYYWARNGTYWRLGVLHVGGGIASRWFVVEIGSALRDLVRGKIPWTVSRLHGLLAGIIHSIRCGLQSSLVSLHHRQG